MRFLAIALLLLAFPVNDWEHSELVDEMTGEATDVFISSPSDPTSPMNFPYGSTTSIMAIYCKADGTTGVAFRFSEAPNITNAEIVDGHNIINTRIRVGDDVLPIRLQQQWGDQQLSGFDASLIPHLLDADRALLELRWHGSGSVRFPFDLTGLHAHAEKVRSVCNW